MEKTPQKSVVRSVSLGYCQVVREEDELDLSENEQGFLCCFGGPEGQMRKEKIDGREQRREDADDNIRGKVVHENHL